MAAGLTPGYERRLDRLAWALYARGVRPNHFTIAQVPVYAAQLWLGARGELAGFVALVVVTVLLDGADGIMARRTGTVSPRGRLLDAFFDLVGIGVALLVAARLHPEYARWCLLLMAANLMLYYQNEVRGEKAVAYARGPVVIGLLTEPRFPGTLGLGIALPLLVSLLVLGSRLRARKREPAIPLGPRSGSPREAP